MLVDLQCLSCARVVERVALSKTQAAYCGYKDGGCIEDVIPSHNKVRNICNTEMVVVHKYRSSSTKPKATA